MKSDALSDQLITFTRILYKTLSIEYCDLLSAAFNQACALQFPGRIRDRWSLDAQHFSEQILRDRQGVVVTAVAHHE
jgi:hypothetical protein